MLGKFLYAKRLNIDVATNKKNISKNYTALELKNIDPPFYFNPLNLMEKSGLTSNMFI